MDSDPVKVVPANLAPYLKGFCERVARQLGVETSLVERVALGEHESRSIEDGLTRELRAIAKQYAARGDAA